MLALRDKGGAWNIFGVQNRENDTLWEELEYADHVKWQECQFRRHGLGGFLSEVTVVVYDSWRVVYVYDKNVC